MQPYFEPTKKTTSTKKSGRLPKKNGEEKNGRQPHKK
jgi:hypothetical protein